MNKVTQNVRTKRQLRFTSVISFVTNSDSYDCFMISMLSAFERLTPSKLAHSIFTPSIWAPYNNKGQGEVKIEQF